jgi:dihydroorotate dehydrogenase electron transfer subunit
VRFLYKDVGKGTRLLSVLKAGDAIDALGPLGNGFPVPKGMTKALLVAGGIGVAPLLGLAERIKAARRGVEVVSFIGGRGADDLLAVRELGGLGIRAYLCTEDGSLARCGVVTDTLGEYVAKVGGNGTGGWVVYSCGPRGMMRAVHGLCAQHGLVHYASLESHMACGIGACMGCVTRVLVEGEEAYRLVCKDGPVFDAYKVVW